MAHTFSILFLYFTYKALGIFSGIHNHTRKLQIWSKFVTFVNILIATYFLYFLFKMFVLQQPTKISDFLMYMQVFFIYLTIGCLYLTLLFKKRSVIFIEKLFFDLNNDFIRISYEKLITSCLAKKYFVIISINMIYLSYEIYVNTKNIVIVNFSYHRLFIYISIFIYMSIISYLMLLFCICCQFITHTYILLKKELVMIIKCINSCKDKRWSLLTTRNLIDKLNFLMSSLLKINYFQRKSIRLLGLCVALIYCFLMVTVVTNVSIFLANILLSSLIYIYFF